MNFPKRYLVTIWIQDARLPGQPSRFTKGLVEALAEEGSDSDTPNPRLVRHGVWQWQLAVSGESAPIAHVRAHQRLYDLWMAHMPGHPEIVEVNIAEMSVRVPAVRTADVVEGDVVPTAAPVDR